MQRYYFSAFFAVVLLVMTFVGIPLLHAEEIKGTEISQKLEKVMNIQAEILQQLKEIKEELDVIKVRASRN